MNFKVYISIFLVAIACFGQEHSYIEFENQLLDLISKSQNFASIEGQIQNNTNVAILIGETGSGKSTIFNLLCGAEFELMDEGKVFQIKEGTKNYSQIQHENKNNIQEPVYHLIQKYNLLLIDFPNFQDTGDDIQKLVGQLIINKILVKHQVRIIYVQKQSNFLNKGRDLQMFLQQTFPNTNLKLSETIFLINFFHLDNTEDQNYISNVRNQLFEITNDANSYNQEIYVLRQINQQKRMLELKTIRNDLLTLLTLQNTDLLIKLKPFAVHVEKINNYLENACQNLVIEIKVSLQAEVAKQIDEDNYNAIYSFVMNIESIQKIFVNKNVRVEQQYKSLFNMLQHFPQYHKTSYRKVPTKNILKFSKETTNSTNFMIIFEFFGKYSEYDIGCQNCTNGIIQIQTLVSFIKIQFKEVVQGLEIERVDAVKVGTFFSAYFLSITLKNGEQYISFYEDDGYLPKRSCSDCLIFYSFTLDGWNIKQLERVANSNRVGKKYCFTDDITFVNKMLKALGQPFSFFDAFYSPLVVILLPLCILGRADDPPV